MAVFFKKRLFSNPQKESAPKLYYPYLVTLGQRVDLDTISYRIKERSSLSNGEVLSVLKNFVEVMREALFAGQSVHIAGFGVFSLTCSGAGSTKKEDCTAAKIKQVMIRFLPATSVKIDTTATRAGEKIEFKDIENALKPADASGSDGDGSGSGNGGGGGVIDPNA